MSKYYKAEDVINAIEGKIAEYIPTLYGRYAEIPLEIRMAIEHLPTIEVSEDCISRAEALKAYNEAVDELVKVEMEEFNLGDFTECSFNTTQLKLIARKIENAPSVVPRLDKEDLEDIKEHISESYVEGYMDGHAEGEWIEHKRAEAYDGLMKPNYECSQCHDWLREQTNYCPNCGAKMKGTDNGTVKSKSE